MTPSPNQDPTTANTDLVVVIDNRFGGAFADHAFLHTRSSWEEKVKGQELGSKVIVLPIKGSLYAIESLLSEARKGYVKANEPCKCDGSWHIECPDGVTRYLYGESELTQAVAEARLDELKHQIFGSQEKVFDAYKLTDEQREDLPWLISEGYVCERDVRRLEELTGETLWPPDVAAQLNPQKPITNEEE